MFDDAGWTICFEMRPGWMEPNDLARQRSSWKSTTDTSALRGAAPVGGGLGEAVRLHSRVMCRYGWRKYGIRNISARDMMYRLLLEIQRYDLNIHPPTPTPITCPVTHARPARIFAHRYGTADVDMALLTSGVGGGGFLAREGGGGGGAFLPISKLGEEEVTLTLAERGVKCVRAKPGDGCWSIISL